MNPFARKVRGGLVPRARIHDPMPDRRWERRVDVKIDLAACLRNGLVGLAVLVLAIACAMNPESISFPSASQALAGMLIR